MKTNMIWWILLMIAGIIAFLFGVFIALPLLIFGAVIVAVSGFLIKRTYDHSKK